MSEMVERVAMAMLERSKARVAGINFVTSMPMDGEENFWDLARAAIEAMREPTAEMSRVLGDAAKYGTRSNGEIGPKELMAEIIDVALQD